MSTEDLDELIDSNDNYRESQGAKPIALHNEEQQYPFSGENETSYDRNTPSSDEWERENEIELQADDVWFGVTPPRQIRREKRKDKTPKKQWSKDSCAVGSSERNYIDKRRLFSENRASSNQERSTQRKEKVNSFHMNSDTFGVNDSFFCEIRAGKRPPVIRIEIPNKLKSIHRQTLNQQTDQDVSKADIKKSFKKSPLIHNVPASRFQFHKSFALLVRLGGRLKQPEVKSEKRSDSSSENAWKADYLEVLWLELKAWHAGRSIQDEDCFLARARCSVDDVLEEVVTFNFQEAVQVLEISKGECQEKNLMGTTGVKENAIDDKEPSEKGTEERIETDEITALETASADSTASADCFDRNHQRLAMGAIIALLCKVEHAESLYPTTRALASQHEAYNSEIFVRNLETLSLWLNTCKELFHRMQLSARFIQIDTEDGQVWQDWIDHGLGLQCVKTKQSYSGRRNSCGRQENNTSSVTENNKDASGHHGQYGHQQRASLTGIRPTSTSRYRMFVERCICQMGPIKLSQRFKELLHISLWRARQTLEVTPPAKFNMMKHHNFEKVKKLLLYLETLPTSNITGTGFLHKNITILRSDDFQHISKTERGVWSDGFKEMGLPSFLELYLFLVKLPFDIIVECIRYRLEHKPKGDPSNLSIRQLLQECKEVIYMGVLNKYYFQDMSLSVLTADDTHRIDKIDNAIAEFDDEMEQMLALYFEYIQSLFQMLQRLQQASQNLKNVIEDEWQFAKVICPHIKGGESQAGYKFCVLASGLLESCSHFLESSLDDCTSSLYYHQEDSDSVRHKVLEAHRNLKHIMNETRQRAAKAIGFAKVLQKDLGIAAEFAVVVPMSTFFQSLFANGFVKVDCHSSASFDIFAPGSLAKDPSRVVQLLTVTCGFENPAKVSFTHGDGYILLLNQGLPKDTDSGDHGWKGEIITVSPTIEITIALTKIEVEELMLISHNALKTAESRKALLKIMGNIIQVTNEQTSSHEIIADAMVELKETALKLSDSIVESVHQVTKSLDSNRLQEREETDRALLLGNSVEVVLAGFNFGFEYYRELSHLLTGKRRTELGPRLHKFARMWMEFVSVKVEKGRGRQPRWASHGLGFLIVACEPKNVMYMTEEEFQELQKEMLGCVHHIIGKADQVSRSSSPLPVHRSRSHTPSPNKPLSGKDRLTADLEKRPVGIKTSLSEGSTPISISSNSPFESDVSRLLQTLDGMSPVKSIENCASGGHPSTSKVPVESGPMGRIRTALKQLEHKRNEHLKDSRVIGNETHKRSPVASDLVHVNARRVNFKWQLGRPIGEGQFGKVFTCVNLDTGDIMAMKQIRFNRNDYSTTQEIADEIKNIEGLTNESLVKYYGVELHRDEMLIFMEYCADGTIADVAKLGLPETMIRAYSYQIIKAVAFLHANGIVHRDIKGANIFVSSDGLIKLGDFGSAVKLKNPLHTMHGEVAKTRGVTAAYMAPEVVTLDKGKGYGRAADIWSVGCVVIEMATGKRPWSETENMFSIMFRVGNGDTPLIPDSLSEEGKDFLVKCFIRDPRQRWTAEQLKDHIFLKVGNPAV